MNNLINQEEEYNEELQEEGYEEEGVLNDSDSYVEEEEEESEHVDQEELDSETIDAPEDWAVEIPVLQLDGSYKEAVFDQDGLSSIVAKGQHFDTLLQQAQELQNQVAALQQNTQQSKALVDFVASDPVLSRMTYMKANGYSTQEILNDLQQFASMENNQTDPYLDDLDDTQKKIYLQVKEEQSKRAQLEQQIAAMQAERTAETVATHNSRIFDEALVDLGLDYTGQADIPKIQKAVAELYPNIDARTFKFSKQQAEAILRQAGLSKRTSKTNAKIQQVNKAKAAPRVIGGSKSSGTNKRQVQQKLGNTIEERRKALLGLGL